MAMTKTEWEDWKKDFNEGCNRIVREIHKEDLRKALDKGTLNQETLNDYQRDILRERTENASDGRSDETVESGASNSPEDNIYLRMPLDRVRKDAENGVLKAKEALKFLERNTEIAGKDSDSTPVPETLKTPREQKEEARLKHLLRERYNGAEVEFVEPQDDSQRAVAEFFQKELGKTSDFSRER